MTLHLDYSHQCPECKAYFIPYKKDFKCPNCGKVSEITIPNFISEAVDSIQFNLSEHGSYQPPAWYVGSFGDHVMSLLFKIFEAKRISKRKISFDEFAKEYLSKMIWKTQEYLEKHILELAIEVEKKLGKK